MNRWHLLIILAVIIVIAGGLLFLLPNPAQAPAPRPDGTATSTPTQKASLDDLIVVDSLLPGAAIASPLTITGKARGNWYFEASFPIYIVDWDGKIIAQGHAEAQSNWMTTEYVPFKATLKFTAPTSSPSIPNRGAVILHNDNPSGDPARDKALEIPVVFK